MLTKIADVKHNVIQDLMLMEEVAYDHNCPDYVLNALRRIYSLALLCNDIKKLKALLALQDKIIEEAIK